YGSGTVSVLLGNGDGSFLTSVDFAAGTGPSGVAAADVNGDGTPDLLVTDAGDNAVTVLLNEAAPAGTGTFPAGHNFRSRAAPRSVAVAGVNGDGHPDLVTPFYLQPFGYGVSVLLGNGNGTFQAATNFATDKGPRSVAVADVNGDGHPDLITADYGGGDV